MKSLRDLFNELNKDILDVGSGKKKTRHIAKTIITFLNYKLFNHN